MAEQPEFLMNHPNLSPERRQRPAFRLPDIGAEHGNHPAAGTKCRVHEP
jgi:hypothetical protein